MASFEKENDRLLKAASALLQKLGWKVLVVGGLKIEERTPLKYNYRLTIDFTGSKPDVADKR